MRPALKLLLASGYPMAALNDPDLKELSFISKPYRWTELDEKLPRATNGAQVDGTGESPGKSCSVDAVPGRRTGRRTRPHLQRGAVVEINAPLRQLCALLSSGFAAPTGIFAKVGTESGTRIPGFT